MKSIFLCLIAQSFILFSVHSQITFNKLNVSQMQSNAAYSEVLDFNNDGYFDIVYCDVNQSKVKLLLNDKSGGFTLLKEVTENMTSLNSTNILIGDFDKDLFTDFMLTFRDQKHDDFVKVYKNIGGNDFELLFDEQIYKTDNNYESGPVFLDFDNDNDLDIVSRYGVYSYSKSEVYSSKGTFVNIFVPSWPKLIVSDSQFRNPNCFGNLNVKNNLIYDCDSSVWNIDLSVALDTTFLLKNSPWKDGSNNVDSKSAMFIELGGDDRTDHLWLDMEDNKYCFKYSTVWNHNPAIKLFDVGAMSLIRWDVADMNGDKVLDIVYIKDGELESNEVWVAELSFNEDSILTLLNHYKVYNTPSVCSSLKLVDIDNDNDLDIVNSNDVYLNQSTFIADDTNGKVFDLNSEYKPDLGKFNLSWNDTSSNKKELLRYDIVISMDKVEMQNMIQSKNLHRASRFPKVTTHNLSNESLKGVHESGWHYWTVRSINSSLRGSEWAEVDSFYFENNQIVGPQSPCVNSSCFYSLKPDNDEATHIEWVINGTGAKIYSHTNYLKVRFIEPGSFKIAALLYKNWQLLDSIGTTIYVKAYPNIEIDGPEIACPGSKVLIRNIAENGGDSINYSWRLLTSPVIEEEGYGLDSISLLMPTNRKILSAYLSTVEDDKYCAFNGRLQTDIGRLVIRSYNRDQMGNGFIAPEVVCGDQLVNIKLDSSLDREAKYNWEVDGAEIIQNQSDSVLVLNWHENVSKGISLSIEKYGCISDTNTIVVNRKPNPKISIDFENLICHGQGVPLRFDGSTGAGSTFNWDFEGADVISGSGEGPYNLQWNTGGVKQLSLSVNDAGCISDSSFTVEVSEIPVTPDLCGLSVNTENNAVIYWKVPSTENIDSVYVYKESIQANIYEKLAAYVKGEVSSFVDTATDCSSQAYRYRMTILDTCGFETEMSAYHKSLHLMLNQGQKGSWNLIWSAYEGLDVGTYSIYRGTTKENMMKIADISGNVYSFTDQYPPLGDLYYSIAISNTQSCTSILKSSTMDEFIIQSNVVETSIFNGISDVMFDKLYKVGTQKHILNVFTNEIKDYSLELIDVRGKTMYRSDDISGNFTKEINGITSGIYMVKLEFDNDTKTRKVMFK